MNIDQRKIILPDALRSSLSSQFNTDQFNLLSKVLFYYREYYYVVYHERLKGMKDKTMQMFYSDLILNEIRYKWKIRRTGYMVLACVYLIERRQCQLKNKYPKRPEVIRLFHTSHPTSRPNYAGVSAVNWLVTNEFLLSDKKHYKLSAKGKEVLNYYNTRLNVLVRSFEQKITDREYRNYLESI